ncbi:peptidase, S41 family [Selenomonas sp. oral taxon 892 str. F0426]|uniref:S41 family peptidase n=1 Tax=Selenomonas sp. oral taxon 892 TaxID=1321785 RepID=UPI0003AD1E47|nr:S41 family peptidase [Selenomonas sp. oral taxon 892]ERJ95059.1 peptidase, S41 family [Selenomonas sp. oral taxon 892 str. F0426]
MNRKKLIIVVVLSALLGSMLTLFAAGAGLRSMGLYADDVLRFFGVMKFIQARYVNAPNTTALIDGAIDGMVASLDDPHSVYMPPSMFKELRQHTEGSFGGIGVTMGFKDNVVRIISVLEGTPGETAGLRAGDEILAVDGTPTNALQNEEVALRIRGEAGTQVVLRILRDGTEQDYTITRDVIQVPSVRGMMVEGTTMGYIRIGSFAEHTGDEFTSEMNRLAGSGMTSLIIDLRANPGGLITSCVAVAEQVVPAGTIVSVIDRDGGEEVYRSSLAARKYPIVVLIDENSASASEILAGALQDTGAGTIIGTTSYGKGSVQAVLPLFHEDGLKLTIAKYVTPNGRSIDGTGITPDIVIERSPSDTKDVQFEAAKQYLTEHPSL